MINLQSDIVNLPTDAMWSAMQDAELGWVIDREDRNVRRLEELSAEKMGKEAGLFVLTGRMATLVAVMTTCRRGNQVILEENAHIVWSQEWGLAYVVGAFPRILPGRAGVLSPEAVESAICESRFKHRPTTDLVCLENTHNMAGGTVWTKAQTDAVCEVAHRHGARVLLDGARVFHAAIALGLSAADLASNCDIVTFNLTKGLSAPAGAVLCGPRSLIEEAYRHLGHIGAHAFHKAGMLAAAGIVALETMVDRLAEDQTRAKRFAKSLSELEGVFVNLESVHTNIVMADISASGLEAGRFLEALEERGIRAHKYTTGMIRFTFHRHITDSDADSAVAAVADVLRETRD